MTAPRTCVAAVLSTVPGRGVSETHAEEIASAVLRAFVEGEPGGVWHIAGVADYPGTTTPGGFAVCRDLGRGLTEIVADGLSRGRADAFRNLLNYLEADHAS